MIPSPASVLGVTDWLKRKFQTPSAPKENEMLVYAFARYLERKDAIDWIRRVYDNYPLHDADALAMIGGRAELEFLLEKVAVYKGRGRVGQASSVPSRSLKENWQRKEVSFYLIPMDSLNKYYDEITKAILGTKEFSITEVRELTAIKVMELVREEYPRILEVVKSKNIDAIKNLPSSTTRTGEDISIMQFMDQKGQSYLVIIYDSDELWQDPQVADFVSL